MSTTKSNLSLQLSESQKRLKGIDQFKAVMMSDQVKECVSSINTTVIDSDGAVEVVKNNVQQLKKTAKQIEEIRKEHTAVLDKEKRAYMEVQKMVIAPLNEVIAQANKKVIEYITEKQKIAAAEEKKLRAKEIDKGSFIDASQFMINKIFELYGAAIHKKDIKTLNKAFTEYLNPKEPLGKIFNLREEFGREKEVKMLHEYMIVAGKKARLYIKDMAEKKDVVQELDHIKNAIQEKFELSLNDVGEKEAAKVTEIQKSTKAVSKGVYHTISSEVVDFNELPAEYKKWVVNEDALKQFIKDNQKGIVDGDVKLKGVKFNVESKIRG